MASMQQIIKSHLAYVLFMIGAITLGTTNYATAQTTTIQNDAFWQTKEGQPIYSQGGGIFRFVDPATGVKKYYWYGVHYLEAERYLKDPSVTYNNCTFESVTCYSSDDLMNWAFEGDVLTKEEANKLGKTWVGRLGVAYIPTIKKYAMVVQHGNQVLFALSDTPTGPFKAHQKISMESMIGTSNTGDQTVFTDEDKNKSYLIYSYGRGRNKIYVSEIGIKDGKVDLLDCTKVFEGQSREGNCMFKYHNKYYMVASNIYGWDASHAYYLVADTIRGPYLPTNNMLIMRGADQDYAHVSQTGFFFNIKGKAQETVVFCGDRWSDFGGNGIGYNQWCPLSFKGSEPYFNSLSSWTPNAKTGKWVVAEDNNFVKNGSFEADRRHIPSSFKPIQSYLTGWSTEVLEGNKVGLDSTTSPVLNYFNSQSDRTFVIGEKSLNMSDNVGFKRKVFQTITSTPYVKLKDGVYTMTAKVKNSIGFSNLEMYAISKDAKFNFQLKGEHVAWETIRIPSIAVKGGKVEIGFLAEGKALANCQVDDVTLVRNH
jgi:hypothetical protein